MRARILTTLAALLLPALPALAGPLDPPPPETVRVWLVEWAGGSTPRVQDGEISYVWGRSRGVLAVVPFDVIGNRRELYAGEWAGYVSAKDTGLHPSVWVEGHGEVTPECQVGAVCERLLPGQPMTWRLDGNAPGRRSYYVFARNFEVRSITTSPGWKPPRELKQKLAVRIVEPEGTGARIGWVAGAEHFKGATAPGGPHGSFAFTSVKCTGEPWGGWGSVLLKGGDPNPERTGDTGARSAGCGDPYVPGAQSAANGPTTWRVEGEVTTPYSNDPSRLVVIDLPRFPS